MFKNKIKKGFNLFELMSVVLLVGLLVVPAGAQDAVKKASDSKQKAEVKEAEAMPVKEKSKFSMAKGSVFATKNFAVSIESVNKDSLVVIERIKNGKSLYAIYEDLSTGKRFCEDLDEKDNIKCESFGLDGKAYTCDDGKLSLDGEDGCKELSPCKSCDTAGKDNKEISDEVKQQLEEAAKQKLEEEKSKVEKKLP